MMDAVIFELTRMVAYIAVTIREWKRPTWDDELIKEINQGSMK